MKYALLVRFLAALLPILVLVGCRSQGSVLEPVQPGQYYVLDSDRQMIRFEFLDYHTGFLRVIQTTEFKDEAETVASGDEIGAPDDEAAPADDGVPERNLGEVVRTLSVVERATGQIGFSPDSPLDLNEHSRAFLPHVPPVGQSVPLGTPGQDDDYGDTMFRVIEHRTVEVLDRQVEVAVLVGRVGARTDELHYSLRSGIVVQAFFRSPDRTDTFRLIETNIPLH